MGNDILLQNVTLIDENGDIVKGLDIGIDRGHITTIGSKLSKTDYGEVLDCSDFIVTPGFVNLHTHSPMNIFKGIAEDVSIDRWFNGEIWPYESKLEPSDVYIGSLLAIAEMIDNGVTSFADHYFYAEEICRAVLESGIRGDIAPTIFGDSNEFSSQLDGATELVQTYNRQHGRLNVRLGPHAPYTCSPESLETIIDRAKELGVGIHIHVSETLDQIISSLDSSGKTPFRVLHEVGGMDVPAIVAHGLYIQEEDMSYLSDDTYMALTPKTYMKLAMGWGTVWHNYRDLPLCIGTDGAASSNSLSPLEQIRYLGLIGKNILGLPQSFTLKELWQIGMRGHEALGFKTGKLKPGYGADLIVWDINMINTLPVYNPLAAIIYSADARNIRHVMVDGKWVKKDGDVNMPLDSIRGEILNRVDNLLKRGKGKAMLYF